MNKKIQAYLQQKNPNFFEGVALYKESDLDASLYVKFITKGASDYNKALLKKELEHLVKIDPKIIAQKRKDIAAEIEAKELAEQEALELAVQEVKKLAEQQAVDKEALEAKRLAAEEELEALRKLPEVVEGIKAKLEDYIKKFDAMSEVFENLKTLSKRVDAIDKFIENQKKKK